MIGHRRRQRGRGRMNMASGFSNCFDAFVFERGFIFAGWLLIGRVGFHV